MYSSFLNVYYSTLYPVILKENILTSTGSSIIKIVSVLSYNITAYT